MNDLNKSREELLDELNALRRRVTQLEYQNRNWKLAEAEQRWIHQFDKINQDASGALQWAGVILSSILSYEKVLDEILEQIGRVVPCTAACILILNSKTTRMFRWRGYQHSKEFSAFKSKPLDFTQIPAFSTVRNAGWPLAIPYVSNDDEWVLMAHQPWIKSSICLPIRTPNRMLGFLRLDSDLSGFYDQAEAERLISFANQAAIAIKNAQLHDRSRKEIVSRVKELKKERNFIKAVLDTTNALVVVTDLEGEIIQFNWACERATGYTLAEVRGTKLWDIFLIPEEVEIAKRAIDNLRTGEKSVTYENRWQTKQGESHFIAWTSTIIAGKSSTADYLVSTGIDITEQKQNQDERENLINELEAFAHTVAHDLQHPLGPIMGFADATIHLYETLSDEEILQNLKAIFKNSQKMSTIINELLLLAGARQKQVVFTELDMGAIVAETMQRLSYTIEEHQAQITLPDTWHKAIGYGPWVEEVWANYLINAVKYGGSPPKIELGSTRLADGMAKFWVRDNGSGLTGEEQAELFIPFTQLSSNNPHGQGLGLSIVRHIIERLGGQVGVESDGLGQGSTFYFTLPIGEK